MALAKFGLRWDSVMLCSVELYDTFVSRRENSGYVVISISIERVKIGRIQTGKILIK